MAAKAKRVGNTVSIEKWEIDGWKAGRKAERVVVAKIATRDHLGRFHSATNFRGTIDKVLKSR
jgi:hypothetical protein